MKSSSQRVRIIKILLVIFLLFLVLHSFCTHHFILFFRGRFSVVKKCVEKITGNEYAAKLVKKRMVGKEDVEDEVYLLRKLKHPHLSGFIDCFDTPKNYVIIVELLAGGRLFDHLVVMDNLTEKVAIGYVREILEGVQHLRDLNIVHLDLKVSVFPFYSRTQIFSLFWVRLPGLLGTRKPPSHFLE